MRCFNRGKEKCDNSSSVYSMSELMSLNMTRDSAMGPNFEMNFKTVDLLHSWKRSEKRRNLRMGNVIFV